MASKKTGFQYWSVETDRYNDKRIKRLKKQFKAVGVAVYDYILNEIYRDMGHHIMWDEDTAFDVAEYWDIKEDLVNEIVNYCCHIGLFNAKLRANESILSSKSILTRWIDWSKKAKRADLIIPEKIKIILEERDKIPEECTGNSGSLTQSKVKESKGKESIVGAAPPPTAQVDFEKREEAFYQSIKPHLSSYGKDLLRKFFDYWREPNKSRTKMRWEQEKNWDLNLRLQRWASSEFNKTEANQQPAAIANKKLSEAVKKIENEHQNN